MIMSDDVDNGAIANQAYCERNAFRWKQLVTVRGQKQNSFTIENCSEYEDDLVILDVELVVHC